MNKNVIHNTAHNYLSGYHISMEHLHEMEKLVVESSNTNFCLDKRLCELAPNSRVITKKCAFIVEIDAEENRKLVDNMQRIFIINVLKKTTADKKRRRHTEVGNLFLKIKVLIFL